MTKLKEYKCISRTKSLKSDLKRIIKIHDEMRFSYFWSPPCSANQRRSYESKNSNSVQFLLNGIEYKIDQITDCSCSNIYYSLAIFVDGKKKDVRAIKKLLKTNRR